MAENPTTRTTTVDPAVAAAMAQILAAQGGGSPAISAPATQQWILAKTDKDTPAPQDPDAPQVAAPPGYAWFRNPSYTAPKATAPQAFGSADLGYYTVDANGNAKLLVPAHTPNADDEIKKALDREQAEQLRLQRQNNAAMGFGYADDDTVAKRAQEARAANISDKEIALKYRQADEDKRQFDIKQAAQDVKDAAAIGLTTAQTAGQQATTQYTGAQTQQVLQNVDIAKAKLPGDLAQAAATLAGTQASTAGTQASTARTNQQILQGNAPTQATPGTGMWNWVRDPNTGEMKQAGINVEYQAKTMPEVAARIGQIQTLMQQKGQEVQAKADAGTITHDQALAEYNQWYAQNVAPQLDSLNQAQQAAQFKQAQDQAALRTAAQTAATAQGTLGVNAFNALRQANPVGPGFAAQMNKIASRSPYMKDVDFGAAVWQGPNPVDLAQQRTQEALKYMDPSAGKVAGVQMPDFQSLDINSLLGANRYMPGAGGPPPLASGMPAWLSGGAPPPPPPAAAPAAPAPPMVSSGAVGPWANGQTPSPGTLWQNSQYVLGG